MRMKYFVHYRDIFCVSYLLVLFCFGSVDASVSSLLITNESFVSVVSTTLLPGPIASVIPNSLLTYILFLRTDDTVVTNAWKDCTIQVKWKPNPLSGK